MSSSDVKLEFLEDNFQQNIQNVSERDEEKAFRWLILACAIFFYILMVYHKEFENCKLLNCLRSELYHIVYKI